MTIRIYIEPFGGAASVLLNKPTHGTEIYSDVSRGLVALMTYLSDPNKAPELIDSLYDTVYNVDCFNECLEYRNSVDDNFLKTRENAELKKWKSFYNRFIKKVTEVGQLEKLKRLKDDEQWAFIRQLMKDPKFFSVSDKKKFESLDDVQLSLLQGDSFDLNENIGAIEEPDQLKLAVATYMFKEGMNKNEVGYQTCGIAFETAVGYNLYKRKSGVAFEEAIAEIFNFMGFNAKQIGGSGDTDVVVCWKDNNGKKITAIIDGKSKSGGFVSHGDISDVAIDAHKDKNNADYIAIVGPGFSGDTIRNHAKKKSFALITDEELSEIAKHAHSLGLTLQEISLIFQVPNGLFQLAELISSKQRELTITSNVISRFRREQDELGGLSPRDLFLLLRNTDDSPSLEELLNVFETLSKPEIGVLTTVTSSRSPENTAYALTEGKRAVNRLRALASAIDRGLFE